MAAKLLSKGFSAKEISEMLEEPMEAVEDILNDL